MPVSTAFDEVTLHRSLDQAAAHMRDLLKKTAIGIVVADRSTLQDWHDQWAAHTVFGNWALSHMNEDRKVVHLALYSGSILCGLCELSGEEELALGVIEGAPHATPLSGHVAASFVSAAQHYASLSGNNSLTAYNLQNPLLITILETLGFEEDPDGLIYPFDMCFTSADGSWPLDWAAYLNHARTRHKDDHAQPFLHGPPR